MYLTKSSCPSSILRQAPHSMSHIRIVLSEDPLTTWFPRYWRQAIPRRWPCSVRTNSLVDVRHTWDRQRSLRQMRATTPEQMHTMSQVYTVKYLDCSVARCRDDVSVIKVNHIDSCSMTNQYSSEDNVFWCLHVPDRYCTILMCVCDNMIRVNGFFCWNAINNRGEGRISQETTTDLWAGDHGVVVESQV